MDPQRDFCDTIVVLRVLLVDIKHQAARHRYCRRVQGLSDVPKPLTCEVALETEHFSVISHF